MGRGREGEGGIGGVGREGEEGGGAGGERGRGGEEESRRWIYISSVSLCMILAAQAFAVTQYLTVPFPYLTGPAHPSLHACLLAHTGPSLLAC